MRACRIDGTGRTVSRHLRHPGVNDYAGTTEEDLPPILEEASGLTTGENFPLGCYSPERIDPGSRAYGMRNTPEVVSGIHDASLAAVDAFYSAFLHDDRAGIGLR